VVAVAVLVDGLEQFIRVRDRGLAALADIDAPGSNVPDVIDDARGDEGIAGGIPIDAPLVGDAIAESSNFLVCVLYRATVAFILTPGSLGFSGSSPETE